MFAKSFGRIAAIAVAAALASCTRVQEGALAGGAIGAGTGAIIGEVTANEPGAGALIGAGVGAVTGALAADAANHRVERGVVYERPVVVERRVVPAPVVVREYPVYDYPYYAPPAVVYPPYAYGPSFSLHYSIGPRYHYGHGGHGWVHRRHR